MKTAEYLAKLADVSSDHVRMLTTNDSTVLEFVYTVGSRNSLVESNESVTEDILRDIDGEGEYWDSRWAGMGSDYGPNVFTVKVVVDGVLTPVAEAALTIAVQLSDYPVLDEDDYSDREHEAVCEAIAGYLGDEIMSEWRAGNLADEIDSDGNRCPPQDACEPDDSFAELNGEGPVYEFLYNVAYDRARDSGEY